MENKNTANVSVKTSSTPIKIMHVKLTGQLSLM